MASVRGCGGPVSPPGAVSPGGTWKSSTRTVRSSPVIPNRRCRAWQAAVLPAPFDPMNGVSPGLEGDDGPLVPEAPEILQHERLDVHDLAFEGAEHPGDLDRRNAPRPCGKPPSEPP